MLKKLIKGLAYGVGGILLIGLLLGVWVYAQSEPLPTGKEGAEADQFARKMMEAVNAEAWENTNVVKWSFAGKRNHVWDKQRHLAEVSWGDNRVLINLNNKSGIAFKDGVKLGDKESEELLKEAWEAWVNDAFWLNPVVKAFDEGVSRKLVELEEGEKALLLTFSNGGVTPGDSYLWQVDSQSYLPVSWKMWVKILPLKGAKIEWGGWQELETGAMVSTLHDSKLFQLRMEDVESADRVEEFFGGKDPFKEIQ